MFGYFIITFLTWAWLLMIYFNISRALILFDFDHMVGMNVDTLNHNKTNSEYHLDILFIQIK